MDSKEEYFEEAIFNNTVNLIVPMLSVTLPRYSASGDSLNLVYQIAFALLGLLAVITYIGVPSSLAIAEAATNSEKERSSSSNSRMLWLLDAIGLNWEECLKKTICDAHKRSTDYGILSVPFQILYPAKFLENTRLTNPFQLAAKIGMQSGDCGNNYNCLFDPLNSLKYLMDWWFPYT